MKLKHTDGLLLWKIIPQTAEQYNESLAASYVAWKEMVGATKRLINGEMYEIAPANINSPELKVGSWLYHFLNIGYIEYFDGIDNFNHYVKMPKTKLTETFTTNVIPAYTDEEGNEVAEITETITLGDHFNTVKENSTDILIKVTDADFDYIFNNLITFQDTFATNILAEDKFNEAIEVGGDFYTAPTNED